ncbi:MAG: hypothetical protein WD049_09155 [Candidatus Paceibacterota bacterium]
MAAKKAKRPNDSPATKKDLTATTAKAVLSSIPVPGAGAFAAFLDDYYPDQVRRQINDFKEVLLEHAERIDQLNCDHERLASLTSQVLLEIPKTTSEDKRKAFRAILLNYASGKSATPHELDAFVSILSPLTDLEMEILRVAESPRDCALEEDLVFAGSVTGELPIPLRKIIENVSEDILMFAYNGLRDKQLIDARRIPGAGVGCELRLEHLELSSFGSSFLDWIKLEERSK